jgi:hypothetical protein
MRRSWGKSKVSDLIEINLEVWTPKATTDLSTPLRFVQDDRAGIGFVLSQVPEAGSPPH